MDFIQGALHTSPHPIGLQSYLRFAEAVSGSGARGVPSYRTPSEDPTGGAAPPETPMSRSLSGVPSTEPDEDAGDDSDPGDEPPPWKKRPRPSDWPLRLLGFQIDAWRGWEEQTPCTNLQERDRTGEPSGGSVT